MSSEPDDLDELDEQVIGNGWPNIGSDVGPVTSDSALDSLLDDVKQSQQGSDVEDDTPDAA